MKLSCVALLVIFLVAPAPLEAGSRKKVLVLGIDGLDPKLLQKFSEQGVLPNFSQLMTSGGFKPLQTSMPPLSPVAWSSFITGMDPGGHGIFDFIHRHPESMEPFLSMSEALPATHTVKIGKWVIPLSSPKINNLRKGVAFWEILERQGVPTTVFRIPANFPPVDAGGKSLSGMGTPDILGTPGTFSYYTNRAVKNERDITGGNVYYVEVKDNHLSAQLHGPRNSYRREKKKQKRRRSKNKVEYVNPDMTLDFDVYLDPQRAIAKIVAGERQFILKEGEWSPWIRIDFEAIPMAVSVSATARFYLKQMRPDFKLYVSPLQINPEDPAMPISTPSDFSCELFDVLGYFYTQELPEDTKAHSGGILTGAEFWSQSQIVYEERRKALDYVLENLEDGFTFFYFSSVDQGCHMLWRYFDSKHPGYQDDAQLKTGIRQLYINLDEAVGAAVEACDENTTLIVMSDHGFCPFYWGVNLNTWLLQNGYVTLKNPARQGRLPYFSNVNWSKTTAYALGLNGLYVNLKGREKNGVVTQANRQQLLDKLEADLLAMRDPRTDQNVVTLVLQTQRDFQGPHVAIGPDIIVGYNWGYRTSWKSPLGEFPKKIFEDNMDPWSGDHSVDYRHVPGVLLSNRKITLDSPALYDLTVAILDEYGIAKPSEMIGQDCLE